MQCKRVTDADLEMLSAEAASRERLRLNANIHEVLSDPIQRLCNAFEPGTYVRPHRHAQAERWELFVVLEGKAVVLTFDEEGRVLERISLGAGMDSRIIEIPPGVVHSLLSLEEGTVLFEVKAGPYTISTDKDFASWAPSEGESGVDQIVRWLSEAQPGERYTAT